LMAATEKQMKGVASGGRWGTLFNTRGLGGGAGRGGGVFVVCLYQRQSDI